MEFLISLMTDPDSRSELLHCVPIESLDSEIQWIINNVIIPAEKEAVSYDAATRALYTKSNDQSLVTTVEKRLADAWMVVKQRERAGDKVSFPSLAKNEALEHYRQTKIKTILLGAADSINASTPSKELYNKIQTELSEISEAFNERPDFEVFVLDKEVEERFKSRKEEELSGHPFVFTDPKMAAKFVYGVRPNQMFGVVADTAVGKSLTLDNWSVDAFKQGFNVLMIKTENEETLTTSRVDSIFSNKNYSSIFRGELTEEEIVDIADEYKLISGINNSHLFLAQVVPFKFTVETIRQIIDKIEREHNLKIQIVFHDSPEHQVPVQRRREGHLDKAAVYHDLKTLVTEKSLIFFSTAQRKVDHGGLFKKPNKKEESEDIVIPTAEQVSGSAEIPRILDYIFMLTKPTARDISLGGVKGFLVKGRGIEATEEVFFIQRDRNTLKQSIGEYNEIQTSTFNDRGGDPIVNNTNAFSDDNMLDAFKGFDNDFKDDLLGIDDLDR